MSIVNTETLQADKLVAKDGTETTEVDIPSLKKRMIVAAVTFSGIGPDPLTIKDSLNVSTVNKIGTGRYKINFKNSLSGHETAQISSSTDRCQLNPIDNFDVNYIEVLTTTSTSYVDGKLVCLTVYSL